MNFVALFFAIAGAVLAAFYALQIFQFFQANGFAAPLLTKLLGCGIGVYFFWRNVKRVKKSSGHEA